MVKTMGISSLAAIIGWTTLCLASTPAQDGKYYEAAKAYADAMVERGRDTYGDKHSPLFAVALNRQTMKIDDFPTERNAFPGVKGVRGKDRSMFGANPQDDMDLYEVLYTLSELTGDQKYAGAADDALEYFFKNCRSPKTDLLAWGEHLFWNLKNDSMGPRRDKHHEIRAAWPFWDACYRLAPDASWQVALAFWDHQIHDKQTGNFSRHALWHHHSPDTDMEFPRYAGQMILTWADAYARPENANRERRAELLTAIEVVMKRMHRNMTLTDSGYLPACSKWPHKYWATSTLELARCLFEARPHVPRQLANDMEQLALLQDKYYLESSPAIARADSGAWAAGYGATSNAAEANMCYRRYVQLKDEHPAVARQYGLLVKAVADRYLAADPKVDELLRPDAIAPALELMLHMYELTRERKYLDRAGDFADIGIEQFIDETSPLPRASNRHEHYEAITGGPRLMLLLLRLHQLETNAFTGEPPIVPPGTF